ALRRCLLCVWLPFFPWRVSFVPLFREDDAERFALLFVPPEALPVCERPWLREPLWPRDPSSLCARVFDFPRVLLFAPPLLERCSALSRETSLLKLLFCPFAA